MTKSIDPASSLSFRQRQARRARIVFRSFVQAIHPRRREQYKSVWTGLSRFQQDAVAHVTGEAREEDIQFSAQETVARLQRTVGIKREDVILEIGCGIGRVGQALVPICQRWIGCDVSPHMLRHARCRLAEARNIELVEISGFDLHPIGDASIDLVYCTVVFMHLDEWDRYNYILEAKRVLKPCGRLFVDNFNLRFEQGWALFETLRVVPPKAPTGTYQQSLHATGAGSIFPSRRFPTGQD